MRFIAVIVAAGAAGGAPAADEATVVHASLFPFTEHPSLLLVRDASDRVINFEEREGYLAGPINGVLGWISLEGEVVTGLAAPRAPSSRIPAEPRFVGGTRDVEPVIPGSSVRMMYGGST